VSRKTSLAITVVLVLLSVLMVVLAAALESYYASGDTSGLESYSERCLRRVWRVQHFSYFMTSMLHRPDGQDPFEAKLQHAQLEYVCRSEAVT